jgi:RHS repeat-associated protein
LTYKQSATASTGTYTYDGNGNMASDPYKAMTLRYNHLNLPTLFDFGAGKTIEVYYDRAGAKLRKTVKTNATTTQYIQDYVGGLEYRTTGTGALTLEAIYHTEGRITPVGANWQYEYSIRDHLGNTRLTFADLNANGVVDVTGNTTTTEILNEYHYYPFGMNMAYDWTNNVGIDNKYQYNGKEMNDDFGLNLNDYGARWYDAALGRWSSVDPLGEKMRRWTPYNYCFGNPWRFVDPDGMAPTTDYYDLKGKKIGSDGVNNGEKKIALSKGATKEIKAAMKKSGVYNDSGRTDIVRAHSNDEIKSFDNIYSKTEKSGNENGIVVGLNKSGVTITQMGEGGPKGMGEDNVKSAEATHLQNGGSIEYEAHSHPSSYTESPEGNRSTGEALPSGDRMYKNSGDIAHLVDLNETHGTKYSIVLGYNKSGGEIRTLGFYFADNRSTIQVNYNNYKNVISKINSQ